MVMVSSKVLLVEKEKGKDEKELTPACLLVHYDSTVF